MAYRKVAALTVFLCLVPWTVRAHYARAIRIAPEPWPDSSLVSRVNGIVTRGLAKHRMLYLKSKPKPIRRMSDAFVEEAKP